MSRVLFLVVEDLEILDLAGPLQAFHEAASAGENYEISLVGLATSVPTAQSLTLASIEPLPSDVGARDVIVVPGSARFRESTWLKRHGALVSWVRNAYEAGATVASVCVGAFLLGAAGLLDGRKCTTHWKYVDQLAQRYPKARVVADRLYVFDERLATSAGIASGIDLTLAMIERRQNSRTAAFVAREMVVTARRPGRHEQLSPFFDNRDHTIHEVHLVQDRLLEDLAASYTLEDLAEHASLSVRTLTRQFRAATGTTINGYVTALRLAKAKELLQTETLSIETVAERCGFADGRQLRRLWKSAYGEPPSRYRTANLHA
jgi:transcriptional regulator GlxA family with amidase domain